MEGSGFAEVILEPGICSSGSINGVMKGKYYNRAMRVHLAVREALDRLLLERFVSSVDGKKLSSNPHEDLSKEFLEISLEDSSFIHFFDGYKKFRKDVASGLHGKTEQFWLSYMNHVELIMRFLMRTDKNDLELYQACITSMCPLYFAFRGISYARYLFPCVLYTLHMVASAMQDIYPSSRYFFKPLIRHILAQRDC